MKKYLMYALVTLSLTLSLTLLGATPARAEQYYITSGGESLNALAEQYAADAELLAAINNCAADQPMTAGELLLLPEQPALQLTVQSGDTLYSLARQYDTTVSELCEDNGISDAALIYPGQTLLLPLDEEQSAYPSDVAEAVVMPVFASRSSTYSWPVEGVITSLFGLRSRDFHSGLDLAADSGTPIGAAAAGYVIESDWKNDAYGYTVMLDHGDGRQTLYAHCSELLVQVGDVVRRGQSVALLGNTGNSTGPHVHFEVRVDGICVDPLDYLR